MGLNEILESKGIENIKFSHIDALNVLFERELVSAINEKEKFIANFDFRKKYNVKDYFKDNISDLLRNWSNYKYVTTNKGVIAIEKYEKESNKEIRDKTKLSHSYNQNVVAWIAIVLSIISIIISRF